MAMSFLRLRTPFTQAARSLHLAAIPTRQAIQPRFSLNFQQRAGYAATAGPSKENIQNRVLEVMKSFEKVDPAKVANASRFKEDLGLDSLDAVEVVMAIEEEFSIEIPDAEADEIVTVQQAIEYIAKTPEAH